MHLGKKGEQIAKKHLILNGYQIIAQNYYSEFGEIDIIAEKETEKKRTIFFFEVKTRTPFSLNHPAESLTRQKLQRLIKTALRYMSENNEIKSWRIALIGILLHRHIPPEIEIIEIY